MIFKFLFLYAVFINILRNYIKQTKIQTINYLIPVLQEEIFMLALNKTPDEKNTRNKCFNEEFCFVCIKITS